MQVRLLGPVEVVAHDHPRPVRGFRRKAVLAVLALHGGEIVSTGRLVEAVWGNAAPPTALNTLQSHVSYLRGVLGSRTAIVARPPGYVLDLDGDPTDVQLVEQLLRRGRQAADPAQAVRHLAAALALWRGPPMADLTGVAWLEEQAQRLDLLRGEVKRSLFEARLAAGEHEPLVRDLARMAAGHPLDEQVHAQLMLALYRCGRQADALAVYHRVRRTLAEELGIDPSQRLRDLETAILRQDPALDAPAPTAARRVVAPAARSAPAAPEAPIPVQLPLAVPVAAEHGAKVAEHGAKVAERGVKVAERGAKAASLHVIRPAAAATSRSAASGEPGSRGPAGAGAPRPAPLTSFVGRVAERAALAGALAAHRLVTAVGPGGVGKTRLALSVAADMAGRYADGSWYVDLVPVTDPSMIAPAVAAALGISEHQGRPWEDIVLGWLATRETLVVLDNCEHLINGVAVLLEQLLASSPRLTVLVTSRARLLVPFEWVFAVPGLCVDADDGGPGDAVELFQVRAAAGGTTLTTNDMARVAAVCRGLDGMALAIELAAARVPSLGLDGIEAGLAGQLRLLTGGQRADERHGSLRSALDWSHALLDEAGQAMLRRVSVFAGPFTVAAAAAVLAGWPPVAGDAIATLLAALADQSLLVPVADRAGTCYRALETIRQYAADRLIDAGELTEAHSRHLSWCLGAAAALGPAAADDADGWRPAFDQVADELRSALGWAASNTRCHQQAFQLAISLAELSFARGMPGESQLRYEQAARLATSDSAAAAALHCAAGAAEARHFGTEALRLRQAAADTAILAGDRAAAATELARTAEFINRAPGLMATPAATNQVAALLAEASRLAAGDLTAEARTLIGAAFNHADTEPAAVELAERAMTLARRATDPLAESAALDKLTSTQLARGEVRAAAASALRRTQLLAPLRPTAAAGMEFYDAFIMATECAVAAGDLRAARTLAGRAGDLPSHRDDGHLATSRLIVVAALAGDWDEALALAERFRQGWDRAGRPRAGNLSRAAYAAATVHGLRGNDEARAAWLDIVDALTTPGWPLSRIHVGEFFDALLLHRGFPRQAMRLLATPPEQFRAWYSGMWRPWYAALWAEAAVLAGHQDATDRIRRARHMTRENPIAAAIVDRAAALAGDGRDLVPAATALAAAGCRYQWARTLVLMGGAERAQGESVLAGMAATPMAWPVPDKAEPGGVGVVIPRSPVAPQHLRTFSSSAIPRDEGPHGSHPVSAGPASPSVGARSSAGSVV